MLVHKRLLQPQLENDFSQARLLWLAVESKLCIIISLLSNTLPPSSAPGFCPGHETRPLPGFHLPISRHISHHLPPGISCISRCPSALCQPGALARPRGSVPALPALPFLCPQVPAGAGPAPAASPGRFPGAGDAPGAAPPARAGPGGMAAAAAPSSARLRAGPSPSGAGVPPGSFAPPAVPHGAALLCPESPAGHTGSFLQGRDSGERAGSAPKALGERKTFASRRGE